MDDAVLTALAKLPADRFATAAEFAAVLSGAGMPVGRSTRVRTRAPAAAPAGRRAAVYGGLALAVALALAAIVTVSTRSRTGPAPATAPVIRFAIEPGPGAEVAYPVGNIATYVALSPDGQQAVYAARHGGPDWEAPVRAAM